MSHKHDYTSCHVSKGPHGLTKSHTYPPAKTNQHQTYAIAHTARCKLHIAADRPDRNLRFLLGHSFTLDNALLRIVEIENQSAQQQFEGKAKKGAKGQDESEGKSGNLAGRRVSFSDNNSRPSQTTAAAATTTITSSNPRKRTKSPPPAARAIEDDHTSSDDYDDPDDAALYDRPSYSDDEELVEEPDQIDGGDGGGLMRFQSASAMAPRKNTPQEAPATHAADRNKKDVPPARSPPSMSSDEEEDEEEEEPETPPSLPTDVDIAQILSGDEDQDLKEMYESVRRCTCHGGVGGDGVEALGVWNVGGGKKDKTQADGSGKDKQYALIKVAA